MCRFSSQVVYPACFHTADSKSVPRWALKPLKACNAHIEALWEAYHEAADRTEHEDSEDGAQPRRAPVADAPVCPVMEIVPDTQSEVLPRLGADGPASSAFGPVCDMCAAFKATADEDWERLLRLLVKVSERAAAGAFKTADGWAPPHALASMRPAPEEVLRYLRQVRELSFSNDALHNVFRNHRWATFIFFQRLLVHCLVTMGILGLPRWADADRIFKYGTAQWTAVAQTMGLLMAGQNFGAGDGHDDEVVLPALPAAPRLLNCMRLVGRTNWVKPPPFGASDNVPSSDGGEAEAGAEEGLFVMEM